MITQRHLNKMKQCVHLLPAPGPDVANELITEVEKLRKALSDCYYPENDWQCKIIDDALGEGDVETRPEKKIDELPYDQPPYFIFDVESIGLSGEGFAVAGGIFIDGVLSDEFCFSCLPETTWGHMVDRDWVKRNIPPIAVSHPGPVEMRESFWKLWSEMKSRFPLLVMAGECIYPVETNFINLCMGDYRVTGGGVERNGPYPFLDISSVMQAAGMDPLATYERTANELPAHEPLADVRLSARLLHLAFINTSPKS